ncbi:MAG: hypothetical protein PHY34_00395 [Patescibacteria group bacterium]|nr:hypothetical protein [Patescibacteria group bacterium]MDD5715909.1 hypothetical protein [Patescibacteria group bacterium]
MTPRQVAVYAARSAVQMLQKHLRHIKATTKFELPRHETTSIDVMVERMLIRRIQKAFPSHGIFSDVYWKSEKRARYVWLIDPIDGMINSLHNIPCFCTSIALIKDSRVVLGVVANHILGDVYVAERGKGSVLNHKRIHVSANGMLSQAVVCTGWYSWHVQDTRKKYIPRGLHILQKLAPVVRKVRILGSAPWVLTRIADGSIDVWTADTTGINMAAASLIVAEAGGTVTDLGGKEINPFDTKVHRIVAANKQLHTQVLKLLR